VAVYAIGDVQGCMTPLRALLDRLDFNAGRDQLWFTGDLVNRGLESLAVLRFVKSLGENAITVLGNHDLHLLAVAAEVEKPRSRDTLDDILTAPDRNELLNWLRARPLLHHDRALGFSLVHAGLLPQWDLALAQQLAREVQEEITSHSSDFFGQMYGDMPDVWHEGLRGAERLRVIVNAFTRLRYCNREGRMDLHHKGPPGTQPSYLMPWFEAPGRRSRGQRIVFGHWSTLGRYHENDVVGLDSGCLWGRALTAVRLDAPSIRFVDVPCARQNSD
jgi:bis(5'-nucleosyl)-tetraphosphatase (symmetrical)